MICKRTFMAIAAAVLGFANSAQAQGEGDFQTWLGVFFYGPPSENSRLLIWFNGQARFSEQTTRFGQYVIRPGLGWRVSDGLDAYTGYARVVSRNGDGPDVPENRAWQQAVFPVAEIFGGALTGRTRLEQRLRQTGDDTGWRARQKFRWERPLADPRLSALVANELFVNLNDADWGQQAGFEQNRLFFGGVYRPTKHARFEGGYFKNVINLLEPGTQINHNLSIALFVSL